MGRVFVIGVALIALPRCSAPQGVQLPHMRYKEYTWHLQGEAWVANQPVPTKELLELGVEQ